MREDKTTNIERQMLIDWRVNGNNNALQYLIINNTPFVHYIAKKYYHPNTYDDIVQEGILGLIHAINKFDLSCNHKLVTYAKWHITDYIQRYLRTVWRETPLAYTDELITAEFPSPETFYLKSELDNRIDNAIIKVLSHAR